MHLIQTNSKTLKGILIGLFLMLSLGFISAQPTTIVDYDRGIDVVHPETRYVSVDENLEFSFWTYNSTAGQSLTNETVNCSVYFIDNTGDNFYKFSNYGEGTGVIDFGKGHPYCINCWYLEMPKENLSIGIYSYHLKCQDELNEIGGYSVGQFEVTPNGEAYSSFQGFILIGLIGLIALFFSLARVFEKKKWKVRMAFDILALLTGIVLANSIKMMASSSATLNTMGTSLLIGVITISFFMISYMLIMMTIEVIQYFKRENRKKWSLDNEPY